VTRTRLTIDQLRAARRRREQYFGAWLPEPLLTDTGGDPAELADVSDSLSLSAAGRAGPGSLGAP
jgi:RNA polymerase sigma-70 factor, ECF subfamily